MPGSTDWPWWSRASAAVLVGGVMLLDAYLITPGAAEGGTSGGVPWLSAGLAMACLLRGGMSLWPWLLAAFAGAGLLLGMAPVPAALLAGGTTLTVLACAAVLRHTSARPDLERTRDAWAIVGVAAGVGASLLVGVHHALGAMFAGLAWEGTVLGSPWLAWPWHLVGLLLGAVPALALTRSTRWSVQTRAQRAITLAVSAGAVAGAGFWLLIDGGGTAIGPLVAAWSPVLLITLVLRGSFTLPSLALLAIGILSAAAAARGLGPFGTMAAGPALASVCLGVGALTVGVLSARAAGQSLKLREHRAATAVGAARLAVAEWHLRRPEDVHLSRDWLALTRHADPATWTLHAWLSDVHLDDRQRLQEALTEVSLGEREQWQQELRIQSQDGWHWVELNVVAAELDQSGRPLRLVATMADVSERHEAQERQRLSASLFEHLHEGLLIADADLRVLDANAAYSQILGVPLADLLGTVPSLLRPTPNDPLARQQRAAMWVGLRSHGRWRGELIERRRGGEICTLQATISQVHGPEGDLRYHVLAISDITEARLQREKLERQAHFDELTRLPNRVRLTQLLADAMRAADRDGYLLAVCYLDLDRFKPVNDRHGHAGGDRLLVELAGRLRGALRSRDLWADAAARLGGDEFVLLLRAGTMEEARLAVERVLRVVAQPYVIDPAHEPVQITASVGATVYPIDRSDADTLLRHADHAMYGAKQSGRNGYLFFDPEQRRRTEERVMAIGRVQEALDRSEFVLFYQPIVDMRSGRVLGMEALLRWEHPQKGMIAPLQFLPLIANTGLSARVGDWVIGQALDHLAQWRRSGLDITVNVNISARHLQEPDFVQRLSELLARHDEPLAAHLKLEIVESEAHADLAASSELLARCRALGVRSGLDDFGTGHSTLTHLQRLPVDSLKIDRSFVNHMLDDAQDRALVEGVIGLARTFGCSVVAEGVETPAQARMLLDLGCDLGQGTGIGAPMPAGQVAEWTRAYGGMFALAPAADTRSAHSGNGVER